MAKKEDKENKEMAALVKAIKTNTKKWADKYFQEDNVQSAKAKKLSKMLGEFTFGKTDKALLGKLLSEATGENIACETEENMEFRPIVAFVLTKLNTTDAKHSYETEKVLLSIGDGTAVSPEGVVSGFIPKKTSIMRPATESEIDSVPEKQLDKLAEEANIVFSAA